MATTPNSMTAPEPPLAPADEECCRSGCPYCVFDIYQDELEQYRLALTAWQAATQAAAQTPPATETASVTRHDAG